MMASVDGARASDCVDGARASDCVDGARASDCVDGARASDCVDGARASDKPTDACYKCQCDPCAFSGLVNEASTFCKQCREYMCVTCESAHSGSKLTRNHTMVSGSELASTGQSVVASYSARPNTTGPSGAASLSTRPESSGQSVAASRSTRPETTGPSGAASLSTRHKSSGQSVVASLSCVVFSYVINVNSDHISGSAVMPAGRVILADCKNKQIILLDNDFTVMSTLTLAGKPHDVAVYGNNAAVLTVLGMKQLHYIHVGTTLRAGRTIPTGLPCYGVAVYDGKIYVGLWSDQHDCYVQVMDPRGMVTTRHMVDGIYGPLSGYITVGPGGVVYMSERGTCTIACYTGTGRVVYRVGYECMSSPMGMSVYKDGNLLVCCSRSNTIHVLGKRGAHHRVILSSADGVRRPQSVSYRHSDQTLIVTMCNTPSVRAYKLTKSEAWWSRSKAFTADACQERRRAGIMKNKNKNVLFDLN